MNQETYTFAGFTFPRPVGILPRGSFAKRAERMRNPITGPYVMDPKPRTPGAVSWYFYLDSDFMPGLRWQWCDDVSTSIHHTGWFMDERWSDTIRGIVMRLPHGRGFLAGWSMGEHMASEVQSDIYQDERDAARVADQLAEQVAEREREFSLENSDSEE